MQCDHKPGIRPRWIDFCQHLTEEVTRIAIDLIDFSNHVNVVWAATLTATKLCALSPQNVASPYLTLAAFQTVF
jgi:hypothetical protein